MGERPLVRIALAAALSLAVTAGILTAPVSAQSLSDRFKSLFGGKPDEPAQETPAAPAAPGGLTENQVEDSCPPVAIRAGASTFAVGAPGKQATGSELRYQATITKTARDCRLNGGDIVARIGIQGRVNEKVIATKAYRTTVQMTEDTSVPFTLVADDMVYPLPPGAAVSSYIFYIGFDPQALGPEPKAKKKR